jgi:hypothetical protein
MCEICGGNLGHLPGCPENPILNDEDDDDFINEIAEQLG